jgi:hypothetical protein
VVGPVRLGRFEVERGAALEQVGKQESNSDDDADKGRCCG